MSAPLLVMVLLRAPLQLSKAAIEKALTVLPANFEARLSDVCADDDTFIIFIDDLRFSVVSIPAPIPEVDFEKTLAQPSGASFKPLIEQHSAQLVLICQKPGETMGGAVIAATILHLLALQIGELGDPMAGFWVSSERLADWKQFKKDAKAALPALDNNRPVAFPSTYWVSAQLTQDGRLFGGHTLGLKPFTGYELELTPIEWPMALVAERLVGTVSYLFDAGPVLKDGDTLGVTESEKFQLSLETAPSRLKMALSPSNQ